MSPPSHFPSHGIEENGREAGVFATQGSKPLSTRRVSRAPLEGERTAGTRARLRRRAIDRQRRGARARFRCSWRAF